MANYPFPGSAIESMTRWREIICGSHVPDEYEARLMRIVSDALNAGIVGSSDLFNVVETHLGEEFALAHDPLSGFIENGIRGLEVFYARRAVEKGHTACLGVRKSIRAGQNVGTLHLNGQRFSSAVVTSRRRDGNVGLLLSKHNSSRRWHATLPAYALLLGGQAVQTQ